MKSVPSALTPSNRRRAAIVVNASLRNIRRWLPLLVILSLLCHDGGAYAAPADAVAGEVLQAGVTVTGTLAPGAAQTFTATISEAVWHGIHCTDPQLQVVVGGSNDPADLSQPNHYTVTLSNLTNEARPYGLRLYNYTRAIADIAAFASESLAAHEVPGMAVSLVDGHDIVMLQGFGFADAGQQIAVSADTIFNIGSVSKLFTALAALQLVDAGLLELDAPIANYLPGLRMRERFAASPPITARHLLAHLSGLPGDYFNGSSLRWPAAGDSADLILNTLNDDFASMPVGFTPVYCNNGWSVLESIITEISDTPFDAFLEQGIFAPLGMSSSSARRNAVQQGTLSAVPHFNGKRMPFEYITIASAGGLSSSAADLARLLCMLLGEGTGANGQTILSPAAVRASLEPQASHAAFALRSYFYPGLGWDFVHSELLEFAGRFAIKAGDVSFEHSAVAVLPDARIGVSIQMNGGGLNQNTMAEQFLRYAARDKLGEYGSTDPVQLPQSAPAPWSNEALQSVAGHYACQTGVTRVNVDSQAGTLDLHVNVQSANAYWMTGLMPQENGWFANPEAPDVEISFAKVDAETLLLMRWAGAGKIHEGLFGQRFIPSEISPAWAGRAGTWLTVNIVPGDYDALQLLDQRTLSLHDGILYLDDTIAWQPVSDQLAFSPFYGFRAATALRVDPLDPDSLHYGDLRLQRLDAQPVIAQGDTIEGTILADEVLFYRVAVAAGDAFIIDLATEADLQATIYHDAETAGIAGQMHAVQFSAATDGEIVIAIQRNGPQRGPWRLSLHTASVPFYQKLEFADWPDSLKESAHRYPNTDFGYVFVHDSRSAPSATILKIAVARMNSANAQARPLLFLSGGPGDSGIHCAYQYYLQGFTDSHDVYLIDPRGVNLSQPNLRFVGEESPAEFEYRMHMLQQVDLGNIHTGELAADVGDIIRAFGITEADLIAHSYGTLVAQTIMRNHPAWLRAVVLDGVVAPAIPALNQSGPVRHAALEAFFADVATHALYPDFGDTLYQLADRLQAQPIMLSIAGESLPLDGIGFLDAVIHQLASTDLGYFDRLPAIVWRASNGETAALADLFEFRKDTHVVFNTIHAPVQHTLIIKHDVLPFNSLQAARQASAHLHPLLAALSVDVMQQTIRTADLFADHGQAAAAFAEPLTSPIPTLVINGRYDPRSGTEWAQHVAAHLTNSHLILAPATGHGVLFATNGCTLQLMRDFFADPFTAPPTECLAAMVPEFASPWPLDAPQLAAGDTLHGSLTNQGSAHWFNIGAPAPALAIGSVADLIYELETLSLPEGLQAVVFYSTNGAPIAQLHGKTGIDLSSAQGPFVMGVFAGRELPLPAAYSVSLSVPLRIRQLVLAVTDPHIIWQGPLNAQVQIESANTLNARDAFSPLSGAVRVQQPLLRSDLPDGLTADPARFFRLLMPANP